MLIILIGFGILANILFIQDFSSSEKCYDLIAGYLEPTMINTTLLKEYCNTQYTTFKENLNAIMLIFIGMFLSGLGAQMRNSFDNIRS